MDEYTDLVEWLGLLLNNPRYKLSDDNLKNFQSAFQSTNKIQSIIDLAEQKLKSEKTQIENNLTNEKNEFKERLDEIKKDCDKFKDNQETRSVQIFNDQIEGINRRLIELNEQMISINDQEADLEFPVTEYSEIEQCKQQIKPY